MSPSIKDIAAICGVSDVTVSRILNSKENEGAIKIGEETRSKVLTVARQLGYRPNRLARNLARKRSHVLGFITAFPIDSFAASVMAGVQQVCLTHEYALVLCRASHLATDEFERASEFLAEQKADVILIASHVPVTAYGVLASWLPQLGKPVVLVDQDVPLAHCVCTDDTAGMRAAVEHLIELGHRDIAFACADTSSTVVSRLDGYKLALENAGIPVRDELITNGELSEECGIQSARELLPLKNRPTAIVGASDFVAVGVMRELMAQSVRIPEDISVVGYSDLGWTDLLGLTTVRQNAFQLGVDAATLGLSLLSKDEGEPERPRVNKVLAAELVVRSTSGPARSRSGGSLRPAKL